MSGPRPRTGGFPPDPQWYKDAVIYELHVKAYRDSSGDGIGDFQGLTRQLDYLVDLGITAVWLLPFYPSPLRDDGYDIADYLDVHPDYGTLRDARAFIREAHERGLRVITELVFNHTSDQHPWFQRARRAPAGSSARNWYVWSDTPDRYSETRIIFTDTETSNWTWDPVAGAYYWHRFFSHQPDLNFDEPRVQEALLRATDFWLDAGVDGLRLDAIPYLYERDGKNGENLPETHAFLKRLRAHVDAGYPDRMLLAEANQWPEDSVAYFGDGDECNMCFHFPLMPRLYMALRMEDRTPILDILAQTPDIPATAQWALFLRNHDELTLEMVTDEERDYMYRVYAADPQARINLGIRRRLAPLMGNHRRRIELLNGLLFSLPGTPVIYYGDEIGMGDNVYLGDRDSVRTPMQWSSDRNAGFSSASRQRLYLPVVTDAEYHYEAVNVEAQQTNPQSLLWWMKRVIGLRKLHAALGRGSMRFLRSDNRRILAYVRQHEGETLVVVANLSRYAQWTSIDLSEFEGQVPVELFGSVEFPRVTRDPWQVSLGPHSFLWFRLAADARTAMLLPEARGEPPTIAWQGDLGALAARDRGRLARAILRWAAQEPWYRGGSRPLRSVEIDAVLPFGPEPRQPGLALLVVTYPEGDPERYAVPLAVEPVSATEGTADEGHGALIARLVSPDGEARLVDGSRLPETFEGLLAMVAGGRRVRARGAELVGEPTAGLGGRGRRRVVTSGATLARSGESEPVAVFGDRFEVRLYRSLDDGLNPDLEVGAFLTERGFPFVAPVLGSARLDRSQAGSSTVALVTGHAPNEGSLFEPVRAAAGACLEASQAEPEAPPLTAPGTAALLELAATEPPAVVHRLLGPSLETGRLLGDRLGQLHLALAGAAEDKGFRPEHLAPFHLRALYQSIRSSANESLSLLEQHLPASHPSVQAGAERVISARETLSIHLRRLLETPIRGQRIRVHGDLHLGRILDTGPDVRFVGFEGDPARPLGERRLKRSALVDLASLVLSIQAAAHAARVELESRESGPARVAELPAWSDLWHRWVAASCIRGYRERTSGAVFLPSDQVGFEVLLDVLLLARAAMEVRQALASGPERVDAPLAGLAGLLTA